MHLVNKQYLQKYIFVRKFFIQWEYDEPGFDVACFIEESMGRPYNPIYLGAFPIGAYNRL